MASLACWRCAPSRSASAVLSAPRPKEGGGCPPLATLLPPPDRRWRWVHRTCRLLARLDGHGQPRVLALRATAESAVPTAARPKVGVRVPPPAALLPPPDRRHSCRLPDRLDAHGQPRVLALRAIAECQRCTQRPAPQGGRRVPPPAAFARGSEKGRPRVGAARHRGVQLRAPTGGVRGPGRTKARSTTRA